MQRYINCTQFERLSAAINQTNNFLIENQDLANAN